MFYKPYLILPFQQPYNVGTIVSQVLKAREPKLRYLSNLSRIIHQGVGGTGIQPQACLAPQPAFLFSRMWLLLAALPAPSVSSVNTAPGLVLPPLQPDSHILSSCCARHLEPPPCSPCPFPKFVLPPLHPEQEQTILIFLQYL